MNFKIILLIATVSIHFRACTYAQEISAQEIPLVYRAEHSGAAFAQPQMPTIEELPMVRPLPDPFAWSDGSGRSTDFKDWSRRRSEIKAEIEHYGIGKKPGRPKDISATYEDGVLTVEVTEGDQTLTLTAKISLPEGPVLFQRSLELDVGAAVCQMISSRVETS